MDRPFGRLGIEALETAFDHQRDDIAFLDILLLELSNRTTDRSAQLRARALQALGTASKVANPAKIERALQEPPAPRNIQSQLVVPALPPDPEPGSVLQPVREPLPPLTDAPADVLSAWTALEVLSPPSFRRPEDLAGGDGKVVASLAGPALPWENGGEKARPKTRLYYQVVLGTVDLGLAVNRLMDVYSDTRLDRPAARGRAILAVLMLDREGRPLQAQTSFISSFGWGVPIALSGSLKGLGAWPIEESKLADQLDGLARRSDPDGNLIPVDKLLIEQAFVWLRSALGLPIELVQPPSFAIRSYQYFQHPDPPEPLLLNSFFLGDLAAATGQFRRGEATDNLQRYLGTLNPRVRRDLLQDQAALASSVTPAAFPAARWPGPGRHPLVLLQQAAVNLALEEPRRSGMLAVNGPPGTGKTTLLRDVVAALVAERARIMASFDDPGSAFTFSGQKLKAGNAWITLYKLDERLRGFEILVASSNNKAVENVSAELPGLPAISEDAGELHYFTALSDKLLSRDTWGLIAAVLGNAANRSRFRQTFWWDDDFGLSTYLAAASGNPKPFQRLDPATGNIIESRPPRIVTEAQAPRDHPDALKRWQLARKRFQTALRRSEAMLQELEQARIAAESLPQLAAEEAQAGSRLQAAAALLDGVATLAAEADRKLTRAQQDKEAALSEQRQHRLLRPGFIARLFRTDRFRQWQEVEAGITGLVERTSAAFVHADPLAAEAKRHLDEAATAKIDAAKTLAAVSKKLSNVTRTVDEARERLGACFVDEAFFDRDHASLHRSAPWLDGAAYRLRDDVFVAAMALHKAFVDAAAKQVRNNLGALMATFSGRQLGDDQKAALLPDLWASLFLVVPVVSTTFASIERMLGRLPPEALGWLLVDEAGQALPQAAVGALMRTRRAVIVGDPVQIEPVVVLPDRLTDAVCRRFGVNPDRFNAPVASIQTLADAATPYIAEYPARQGSRTVGVPLLVHRRCAEPMFGISNAIAYEHLMVDAKAPGQSAIRDLLGPSRWFGVEGRAEEKWCPEEGGLVVRMLEQLAAAGVNPDLYIVTPFVVVQDNLRKVILDSGVLRSWTGDPRAWARERVGTVHVVQGREAEAVIFVLGAQAPQQAGARNWAGGRPNILNVAVSRAKEVLYVIGNRRLWREAGLFRELDARMPS